MYEAKEASMQRIDKNRFGPWAIVTGASSGIGKAFASQLAANGLNVVLVARRQAILEELGQKLAKEYGIQYRAVGVDLQKEVHEDMLAHRNAYPHKWVTSSRNGGGTDTNIDHRRVPNLMVFFSRKGQVLPTSSNATDYHPGDVVAWNLGSGITHIGIVVDQKSAESGRNLIVHNIGAGPRMEDMLFQWKVIGHYRYWREPR